MKICTYCGKVFVKNEKQLSDLLRLPGVTLDSYGSANDGSDTWMSINITFAEPLILKPENYDELRFVVSDDLSGLDVLNISAHAKIELRTN